MTLTDASNVGAKTWNFVTSGSSWQLGLVSEFVQKASASGTVYTDDTYTWSQDPAGNPYISAKVSVTDPSTPNAQTAKTTQVLDQYGNVRILLDSDHPFSSEIDHLFSPEADQRSPVKPIAVLL
jgi:hypothetical protein